MALDSQILFQRKVAELGISDETFAKMKAKGWLSLGTFAFCCSAAPGTDGSDGAAFDTLAKELAGEDKVAEIPGLRRLYFESWITSSAELKHRLEQRDGDPPRRLPDIEKAERKKQLAALLRKGMRLKNENEPSDTLIDLSHDIHETEKVSHIGWERCTSRNDETDNKKSVQGMITDKDGYTRVGHTSVDLDADTSTIIKVGDVLVRRGAALHIGHVLSWDIHKALADEIMSALKNDPQPGTAKVTLAQAKDYDREVWRRVADLASGRVKQNPDGTLPLDSLVEKAMLEPRVAMMLMPRQHSGQPAGSAEDAKVTRLEAQLADMKRQLSAGRQHTNNQVASAPASKRRRSGLNSTTQGRGASQTCRIPGLEKMPTNIDGKNVCFGFNLGKCTNASPGAACPKGFHICGGCRRSDCAWPRCSRKR